MNYPKARAENPGLTLKPAFLNIIIQQNKTIRKQLTISNNYSFDISLKPEFLAVDQTTPQLKITNQKHN